MAQREEGCVGEGLGRDYLGGWPAAPETESLGARPTTPTCRTEESVVEPQPSFLSEGLSSDPSWFGPSLFLA